jgi:hypothetical protein
MLQSGIGWVMTWIAERSENGTENIVLYDMTVSIFLAFVRMGMAIAVVYLPGYFCRYRETNHFDVTKEQSRAADSTAARRRGRQVVM